MRRPQLAALAAVAIIVLAACGRPGPEATPVPTATSLPTAAPSALPSPILTPAPTPGVVSAARQTRLGTFFFYWYNCPKDECDATQLSVTPPGWLAPLPRDRDTRDGTAYSSINYDWFEGELRDMLATGIDTVFPVSWGDHPHPWFRQDRLDLLVQANGVLARPLAIGMFIDTTAQQAMYNDFTAEGYRFGADIPRLPLSDRRSGYFFYDRHIKGFFQRIPREMWATVEGRPIIITYTALCCTDLNLAGELWAAVKAAFARDFGVEPWLIVEDTWFTPEARAPGGELLPLDQVADGRYSWGTALHGPASHTLRGYTVSSVGPGFDNSRIVGITEPRRQPRERPPGGGAAADGAFLRASLAAIPANADLVLIETWNEWPESTGIARATYRGIGGKPLPETFYMDIVRHWRERRP
ncbi:MAG: DUF5010 domain-containing protein [Chloroflexi bacterium]|nr:DUF5010 domain-containing protein [Chloroflexota bacterium]